MSDRLREALKQLELRGARVVSQAADDGIGADLTKALAAARRFLALIETGPDYEAAAKALSAGIFQGEIDEVPEVQRKLAHLTVDAALADYLTEEDRE